MDGAPALPPDDDWPKWNAAEMEAAVDYLETLVERNAAATPAVDYLRQPTALRSRRQRAALTRGPESMARPRVNAGTIWSPLAETCQSRDGDRPSEARIARNRAARIACTAISRPPPAFRA